MHEPALTVLGIESSCDESAASVVRRNADGSAKILSNIVFSQLEEHAPYGGVVPEIAARSHIEVINPVIEEALEKAGCTWDDGIGASNYDAYGGSAEVAIPLN